MQKIASQFLFHLITVLASAGLSLRRAEVREMLTRRTCSYYDSFMRHQRQTAGGPRQVRRKGLDMDLEPVTQSKAESWAFTQKS